MSGPHPSRVFEVCQGDGGWFWHELARNGKIVAVSEAFDSKANAVRAAKREAAKVLGSVWREKK